MLTRGRPPKWQPRVEDDRLLRGEGRYVDDVDFPNLVFAGFVRSPHAHARIKSIDAAEARRAPGVLAVLTAADMKAAGVDNISMHAPMGGRGGSKLVVPARPPLADGRTMLVGEPVAAVIAESAKAAEDAAELVAVEYEELASVVDLREAIKPGAPQLWPQAPNNIALDWPGLVTDEANAAEVERIIANAAHVARVSHSNQRIAVVPMETRGGTARFDPMSGGYTVRTCSQGVGVIRDALAAVMKVERDKIRVLTEDVGGGFGVKTAVYPELPVLLVAAKKIGRPVHWMSSRSESFMSDNHARDTYSDAELALDANGKFLALRVRHLAAMGAFVAFRGAQIATNNFARCFPGMYDIPKIDAAVKCVFTNTVQTGPYRGAGRPEANYLLERLVDEAARVAKIDPVEIRRRNFIPPSAMPYKTAVGAVFDSGEFETLLDKGLAASGYAGFEKRRAAAKAKGRLRGIGLSCFLEHAGAVPTEGAALIFRPEKMLSLALGVQSTGQGHATVFARLLAERLDISPQEVKVEQGDSAFEIQGMDAVASRSAMTVSHAVVAVSDRMLAKGRAIAAKIFETSETDVAYRDGVFEIPGSNRRLPLFDLAARAAEMAARGEIAESLDTKGTAETPLTFPNGCHIAEVEIDPETGVAEIVNYTCVDDCGTVLDHTIVEGQVMGSIAQGLGQVLLEQIVYDEGGQLVTGSFMDYGMPRADIMPPVASALHPVPATTNPLGVKGVGEAGTTASLAALMNAIADAIPNGAGRKLDMPATPEKIWRALRG
ncbi:MAG TPA: xanthine dehydrogenase family protein molybdopterin-binding subunit [Xanthobacteraceae bacterium]|nr:xanthine dehydrogenase family protein molybdopterin-binding subunit [Xanthobacteraceae bacterium]